MGNRLVLYRNLSLIISYPLFHENCEMNLQLKRKKIRYVFLVKLFLHVHYTTTSADMTLSYSMVAVQTVWSWLPDSLRDPAISIDRCRRRTYFDADGITQYTQRSRDAL